LAQVWIQGGTELWLFTYQQAMSLVSAHAISSAANSKILGKSQTTTCAGVCSGEEAQHLDLKNFGGHVRYQATRDYPMDSVTTTKPDFRCAKMLAGTGRYQSNEAERDVSTPRSQFFTANSLMGSGRYEGNQDASDATKFAPASTLPSVQVTAGSGRYESCVARDISVAPCTFSSVKLNVGPGRYTEQHESAVTVAADGFRCAKVSAEAGRYQTSATMPESVTPLFGGNFRCAHLLSGSGRYQIDDPYQATEQRESATTDVVDEFLCAKVSAGAGRYQTHAAVAESLTPPSRGNFRCVHLSPGSGRHQTDESDSQTAVITSQSVVLEESSLHLPPSAFENQSVILQEDIVFAARAFFLEASIAGKEHDAIIIAAGQPPQHLSRL